MPKPKIKNESFDESQDKKNDDIKINEKDKSSLAEFTCRPIPTDKELDDFEEFVDNEVREDEIEDSLGEIYKEENGDVANVKKLDIKKKHGFFFWFFTAIFIIAGLASAAYSAYYFYQNSGVDSQAVDLAIESEEAIIAGEEFFYTINLKNLERVDIKDIEIRLTYPANFIFLDSQPAANLRNDTWNFSLLPSHRSDTIKIKGKIIGPAKQTNIILADMTYMPVNFSSEFSKSTSFENVIKDTGLEFTIINANSALVGEDNEIIVKYKANKENYLNNFRLTIESTNDQTEEQINNIEFSEVDEEELEKAKQELVGPGIWQINEVEEKEQDIKVKVKFKDKVSDSQDLIFKFEYEAGAEENKQFYLFYEEVISLEIIKSDLNLTLIINGSQADQGVDFEETLNYTIAYANKGETKMTDVVIMAVLESDFLDWVSLDDQKHGNVSDNSISWSKEEIPDLESLTKNDEGIINFSIKVVQAEAEIDPSKDYQVKSYIQYSIGELVVDGAEEDKEIREDRRSNTIINKINSDLQLNEQVRYFNDDNIAVGSGPQPPKIGETTSYKVYWVITNNLHELNDLLVSAELPHYVKWEDKNRASVGNFEYNEQSHKITWQIGRLPLSVYKADAEFNISITPEEADKNKIIVLMPGTIIQAIDAETKAAINMSGKAKTTKLDDDSIVNDDGRVVE